MKGVAPAEVLRLGIDPVEEHVLPCPVEIRLGEIQGRGGGTAQGRTDGEGPGVGKGVEDGVTCLAAIPDANAVFTLIEKDALRVSRLETCQIANACFVDLEGFGQFRASDQGGRLPCLLVEMFPVGGDGRGKADRPVLQFRRKGWGCGGEEAATGEIIEEDPGEVVTGTVDEAAGISIPEGESGSKFFRCVYFETPKS